MKKVRIVFLIIIISSITSFFYINYIGNNFNKIMYKYINEEVTRFSYNVVNTSVNDVLEKMDTSNLFIIIKNKENQVETLDINTRQINKIIKEINQNVKKRLQQIEEGNIKDLEVSNLFKEGRFKRIKRGVLCEIPINALNNNVAINNIGPTIPIKLSFLGNVKVETITKMKNYGINNIVIEVNVLVEITEQITMPRSSKSATIKIEAPLILKIVQGIVPEYYETDLNGNSITSTIFTK